MKRESIIDYGHIGYRLETQGFVISFGLDDFMKLFLGREDKKMPLIVRAAKLNEAKAAIVSLQQGAHLAGSIVAEAELDDIDSLWSIDGSKIMLFIFDTKSRGSGVSRRIYNDIAGKNGRFASTLKSISNCPHCAKYCPRCLLIERTSPRYLDDDLLDRNHLRRLLR
jgi:ATP-dependent helicase YprA (DUF1998 family)